MNDVEKIIRKFIVEEIMLEKDESKLNFNDGLLERGIIDSQGILDLVIFLEKQFNISIDTEEIIPDNFENVSAISKLINKLS
jgi:acyl carrier protein